MRTKRQKSAHPPSTSRHSLTADCGVENLTALLAQAATKFLPTLPLRGGLTCQSGCRAGDLTMSDHASRMHRGVIAGVEGQSGTARPLLRTGAPIRHLAPGSQVS